MRPWGKRKAKKEFDRANRRRHELINKLFSVGLTQDEWDEYALVTEETRVYIREALPEFPRGARAIHPGT
jgi:hypothetical protein